jgi:hypothetical protein
MRERNEEQRRAFARACEVIDRARANDIRRLKNWEHGMCGCLNAVKPAVTSLTPEEDAAIRNLWDTLPGSTCWMTALFLLCNQPNKETKS